MSGRPTINETYHPQGFGSSPSLQRARKPYNLGNFLIGSSLALFAAGVYSYSISSVKQDDFSDVEDLLPPLAERKNITTIEDEYRSREASKAASLDALAGGSGSGGGSTPVTGSATAPSSLGVIGGSAHRASDVSVADAELGIGASSISASSTSSSSSGGGSIKLPSVSSFWSSTPSATSASSVGVADAELGIGASSPTTPGVVGRSGQLRSGPATRLDNVEWIRRRGLVEPGKGNVIVWGAPNVENVGKVWDGDVRRNRGGRIV